MLEQYIVMYENSDGNMDMFLCNAEDANHACEQWRDAYNGDLLRVGKVVWEENEDV